MVWIGVLALGGAVAATGDPGATIDTRYFLHASQTLLSSHWLETFADPGLQAGPLQVAGIGGAGRLGEAVGVSALRAVSVLQNVALTALVMVGAGAVARPRRRRLVAAAAGVIALAAGTIGSAFFYGHPAEVVDPVLWVLAARASKARRPLVAGSLVGVSAGFETWGILGLAVLLLDRRARAVTLGVGAALAVTTAIYGPFILHGPFAMFAYRWSVAPGTLPSVLGIGPSFGWPLRVLQAAAAGAAGAAVSVLLRRYWAACWIAPLSILCVRIGLDPGRGSWYLLAPQTVALLGAAHMAGSPWLEGVVRSHREAERHRGFWTEDRLWSGRG